jgi:hypothetical protein
MVPEVADLLVERVRVEDTHAKFEALAPHRHQFQLAGLVVWGEASR